MTAIPQFELAAPAGGMFLESLSVRNFRSCYEIEVHFRPDVTLLVGENNAGKSNVIDALRLLTRPVGGRRSRYFESGDLADGCHGSEIEIRGEFAEATEIQRGLHLTALDLDSGAIVYGVRFDTAGERKARPEPFAGPAAAAEGELGHAGAIQHVYLTPLRDAHQALDSARGDRLGAVIEMFFSSEERRTFLDEANRQLRDLRKHELVRTTTTHIQTHIDRLTDPVRGQEVAVDVADQELWRLTRTLRLKMAERGLKPSDLRDSGLGYSNLLFIATVILELRQASEADLTLFLVEEPEAHLHPQLQLVLLDYLTEQAQASAKEDSQQFAGRIQVIASTHSPTFASVVPVGGVVVLKSVERPQATHDDEPTAGATSIDAPVNEDEEQEEQEFDPRLGSKAIAISRLPGLGGSQLRKVDQYLDATRMALLFARSAILVEGIAEAVLLPVLASRCVLAGADELTEKRRRRFKAATIIPVGSVDFEPYIRLLLTPDDGISIADRLVVITDRDPPLAEGADGGQDTELSNRRERLLEIAGQCAADPAQIVVCEASWTFEADLLEHGVNHATLEQAFLKQHPHSQHRWEEIVGADDPRVALYAALKGNRKFISKGEFAHDVALAIESGADFQCPTYLAQAIEALLGD